MRGHAYLSEWVLNIIFAKTYFMKHYKNFSFELIEETIDGVLYIEEWKNIPEYSLYEVSSFGRVKRKGRPSKSKYGNYVNEKIMAAQVTKKGYLRISLKINGKDKWRFVHRLVALAFIDKVEGKPDTNHKTGIKTKNHYSQLEWCTPQENNEHGVAMGLLKRGVNKKPYIRKGYASRLKKVVNVGTKEVFNSAEDVVKIEGYKRSYFGKQLRGDRINTTPYRYVGWDENFIRKPYKEKEKNPIAVFDVNWKFIANFDYKNDAAEFAKTRGDAINDFLKGRCSQVKGYKFKKIAPYGSYIEPIPFIPYVRPPKKIKIKQPITPSKAMIKYDLDGNEVARFSSIGLSAKDANTEKKQFNRSVKKSPRGYYKGFIYKYV